MDNPTRPCACCKTAPRDSSNPSYCKACQRVKHDEAEARREARGGRPFQTTCITCGEVRDGRHKSYCNACIKAWREKRRTIPCIICGRERTGAEQTTLGYCSDCARERWLRREYGITVAEFAEILASQGGRCAICRGEPGGKGWQLDHNHKTGKNRGILCERCNKGLGLLQDDPAIIRKAADYLDA